MRFQNWDNRLVLIDQEIFNSLPNGVALHSISGQRKVKGQDKFDFDTRAGVLAYGFLHSPEAKEEE